MTIQPATRNSNYLCGSTYTYNPSVGANPFAFSSGNLYTGAQAYAQMLLNSVLNRPKMQVFLPQRTVCKPTYSTTFGNLTGSNKGNGISLLGQNQNASLWTSLGYNENKGTELAQNALSNAVGWTGYCARHVKTAIAKTNLGSYQSGNACDMIGILDGNPNFKRISPSGVNLKTLPAGCILVYGRGVAGYSSKYGHTEITTGTGKAVSDGITNNLYKTPTAIYMPIKTDIAIA